MNFAETIVFMSEITELHQIIAKNIVRLRKEQSLTQDELAHQAGVDRTYMGYIENAKYNLSVGKLVQIAEALDTVVDDLITEQVNIELTDVEQINRLFPGIRAYQQLAYKYNINDVFQDNGGKLLQLLLITGLINMPDREGNDAVNVGGQEFELKTVNALLTKSFSTNHHLNPGLIAKYRRVKWIFGVYEGIEVKQVYRLNPEQLEVYFSKWETKWHNDGGKDINNPKIPLSFVAKEGQRLYPVDGKKEGEIYAVSLE